MVLMVEEIKADIEPMEKDELIAFVKKRYIKRYDTTLAFEDLNVKNAIFYVYPVAWNSCAGVVEAVQLIYGYRYRRMENFLRELNLWIDKRGWLAANVIVKIYTTYTARHEARKWWRYDRFIIDTEAVLPLPLTPSYITGVFIDYILGDVLFDVGILTLNPDILLENVRIGYDFKHDFTVIQPWKTIDVDLTYSVVKQQLRYVKGVPYVESEKELVSYETRTIKFTPCIHAKTYPEEVIT